MRKLTFLIPIAALLACTKGDGDSNDSDSGGDSGDADTDTDTDADADFDAASDIVVDYTADSITISLSNTDSTEWFFGMAETASGEAGWYDEACDPDNCHVGDGGLQIAMDSVNATPVVLTGNSQTTLFDDDGDGQGDAFTSSDEDRLTYIVYFNDGVNPGSGACFTWGDDVAYYSADACEEL